MHKLTVQQQPALLTRHSSPRWRLAALARPNVCGRKPGPHRSRDIETHLKVRLGEAAGDSDHGGCQRARDADGGQKFGNVGCEAERDGAVGIQVSSGIVDVKPKVGNIEFAGVLNFRRRHFRNCISRMAMSKGEGVAAQSKLPERSVASRG